MLKFNIMGRYDYNRIFISDSEQETIRNCRVFIGGAATGSVIAECALRLGFEKMTVVDNSNVQLSDLNRHNFTMEDIGHSKADAFSPSTLMQTSGSSTILSTRTTPQPCWKDTPSQSMPSTSPPNPGRRPIWPG